MKIVNVRLRDFYLNYYRPWNGHASKYSLKKVLQFNYSTSGLTFCLYLRSMKLILWSKKWWQKIILIELDPFLWLQSKPVQQMVFFVNKISLVSSFNLIIFVYHQSFNQKYKTRSWMVYSLYCNSCLYSKL